MLADDTIAALEELVAIEAIRRLHVRYCRGVDRLDRELISSVFHPGAVEHHVPWFDGPAEEYADLVLKEGVTRWAGVFCHMVANELITVEGQRASSEWYLLQINRTQTEGSTADYLLCARYLETLERRDGRWGITERWLVRDLTRVDRVDLEYMRDYPSIDGGFFGTRSAEDLSYRLDPPLR